MAAFFLLPAWNNSSFSHETRMVSVILDSHPQLSGAGYRKSPVMHSTPCSLWIELWVQTRWEDASPNWSQRGKDKRPGECWTRVNSVALPFMGYILRLEQARVQEELGGGVSTSPSLQTSPTYDVQLTTFHVTWLWNSLCRSSWPQTRDPSTYAIPCLASFLVLDAGQRPHSSILYCCWGHFRFNQNLISLIKNSRKITQFHF